jgi:hypothetical protein
MAARQRGAKTVSFTAREVHEGMGFTEKRYPLICSAIDADKFLDEAHVTKIRREGPKESNTVRWTYSIGG